MLPDSSTIDLGVNIIFPISTAFCYTERPKYKIYIVGRKKRHICNPEIGIFWVRASSIPIDFSRFLILNQPQSRVLIQLGYRSHEYGVT